MRGRHRFEPDGLPNAGQRPVPALFAMGDFRKRCLPVEPFGPRRQRHPHFDLVILTKVLRIDPEFEGQPPALMAAEMPPIEVNIGEIIDRFEMENRLVTLKPRHRADPALVDPGSTCEPQIGELGLPDARHGYRPPFSIPVPELPLAVERQALALRRCG